MADSPDPLFVGNNDEAVGNFSVDEDWSGKVRIQPLNESDSLSTTTTKSIYVLTLDGVPRTVVDMGSPTAHVSPSTEEALLNRSSVLFVAISFILLMIISLAWLVFYYVQRFRYLHSKERVSRRLAELAKKAVARIPVKTLQPGDRETNSDLDQCAICIEPYRQLDIVRVLPCRHYFHKLCIDPWLLEQRSCPMCKLDILRAYGLRNEFNPTCPSVDGASSTGSAAVPGTGTGPPLGLASAYGSDDGLERVALVHTHTRAPSGAGLTYPPLTYVVLTTAADLSSLYYVRPSLSEAQYPTVSSTDSSSSDSPFNPMVISVVSTGVSDASVPPTSSSSVVWNSQLVGTTTAVLDAVPVQQQYTVSHQHPQHLIDSSIPSHPWPVVGLLTSHSAPGAPGTPVTTAKYHTHPEVTHTTQAFRNPVCSVVRERESVDPSIGTNPTYGSDYYVTDQGPTSPMLYHTAIPSIDLLHTDPTPPCPVTKPLTNAVPSPHSCRLNASPNPNRSTHSSGSGNGGARRSNNAGARSPFITWLLSPWRRTVPAVVPASITEANPEPGLAAVSAFSVSQPLLRPTLSVGPEAERCTGSEQVVFAVVETEPFNRSSSAAAADDDNDNPI